jgi:protein-L-isoaspartate(D-aspartate) O-methyltransferase
MDTMSTDAGADYVAMRHAMVASQLRPNAVDDPRVIAAMASIPREHFLPADARLLAYRDGAIPLGNARWANLPMTTGRLLTEARLAASDRVLLIGSAGGYAAAVLAEIVAQVVAVEGDPALAALARDAFVGRPRVTLVEAPLGDGHADGAPYDVLVIDGAIEAVPPALVAQVVPGGRVVSGVVDQGVIRLASGRKTDGGFGLAAFVDSDCVVLPGFTKPQGFRF